MNNVCEILYIDCNGKNMNKILGICDNKRCQYNRYIPRYIYFCKSCNKILCGLCVKLDRTKCVICKINDEEKKIIEEHENYFHKLYTAICNNCSAILIVCGSTSYCKLHNITIWQMSDDDKDCVKCRKQ